MSECLVERPASTGELVALDVVRRASDGVALAGTAAPDLDRADPEEQKVVNWVSGGAAGMPAYAHALSSEQIERIAAYVANVSSRR